MQIAEKTRSLTPEQYGVEIIIDPLTWQQTRLNNDIFHQLKCPAAICSNNAKTYYDLIDHTQASIAMQHHGVQKSAVDFLFMTLQDAVHHVCTG